MNIPVFDSSGRSPVAETRSGTLLTGDDKARMYIDDLRNSGRLDRSAAKRAISALSQSREPVEVILQELGLIEENNLLESLSQFLGLERVTDISSSAMALTHEELPIDFLKRSNLLPLDITDSAITLATAHPLSDDAARALAYAMGRRLILKLAPLNVIVGQLQLLDASVKGQAGIAGNAADDLVVLDGDAERLRDLASEAPIVRLLTRLIAAAVEREASDIHIEPVIDQVQVRFRIDGALQLSERLDKSLQMGLTSRIKILARLNIAEQRLPQDGRIRFPVKGKEVDFRVSTSPTLYGESVVLRILDRRELDLKFASLGFARMAEDQLRRLITSPNGIFLVTGPTGSGKTTTLYAALSLLNQSQSKLFTVEDPIEYHLAGVNQILVRPHIGLDFAAVLRSILRQDPDIIMIGEIRDGETAKIAVQAALTGHLVLSTLHTNSAAASITRLRDIGIDSFLLGATLRGVLAQRLVRKLCPHCKLPPLSEASSALNPFPAGTYRPVGCQHCNGTGYRGRTVIYELLETTDAVRQAILTDQSEAEIERIARSEGMELLAHSARIKIAAGETSVEDVHRSLGAIEL